MNDEHDNRQADDSKAVQINREVFNIIDNAARALLDEIDSAPFVIVNEDARHITRISMLRAVVVNFLQRGATRS